MAGIVAIVIGRVFGIIELYVIAVASFAAVVAAVLAVRIATTSLTAHRWIHPPILTVGDTGRVDLTIVNEGRTRSPRVTLVEPVGPRETARVTIAPIRAGQQLDAAYRLPASRRGVLELGPRELERRDQLGLAARRRTIAALVEVVVAPRTHELAMPDLGHGVLGRHLLTQAQRLGTGEFHSLRDYVEGDEPRLINWRASARSEALKVRQHTTEGVRRCIVVLDLDRDLYGGPHGTGSDAFERAVTAAASLVQSGDRAGLTTRFVTAGGVDLRGPDVAASTLRVLARVVPGPPVGDVERDPGEGLGLVVVVTASATTSLWRRTDQFLDPSLTRVGVFTGTDEAPVEHVGRLGTDASTIERFLAGWEALAGSGGLDIRRHLVELDPAGVR
ncbi:hypothetical protein BH23ACT3_BH23ACT3_11220 [soil metagenome]